MLTNEKVKTLLENKTSKPTTIKDLNSFSQPYKDLGIIICGLFPKKKYYRNTAGEMNLFREHFGTDHKINPFNTPEGHKLAIEIYGKVIGPYIVQIWDLINTLPYQTGYTRRAFRSIITERYTRNKIEVLVNLSAYIHLGFKNMTEKEIIQFSVYHPYLSLSHVFACIFAKNEPETIELIQDIFQSEDEIGGVHRQLIKGLLISEHKEHWVMVEKLLLAAQRQEGLRQSILEASDETSVKALQYFISAILEHDLTRFSSVVRAIDCWFGFGWEAPKKSTLKRVLELAKDGFENPQNLESNLKSKDNLQVYIALWIIGLTDVDEANRKAIEIIKTGVKEKKILASMFMYETGRTNNTFHHYFESNFGNDVEVDYWLMQNLGKYDVSDEFMNKIYTMASVLPTKGQKFEGNVFSWTIYSIKPEDFFNFMINSASVEQYPIFSQDLSKIPSESRESFMRKVFPSHYSWSLNPSYQKNIPIDLKNQPWKKALMFKALNDRNQSVLATGLNLLQSATFEPEFLPFINQAFSKKHKDLRQTLIRFTLKQNDDHIKTLTTDLIASKKIDQRLAGLEIISELHDQERLNEFGKPIIEAYKSRSKISKNEQVYLDKFEDKTPDFTYHNGFGFIDYSDIKPLYKPTLQLSFETKKGILGIFNKSSKTLYPKNIDTNKVLLAVNEMVDLLDKHKNFEYKSNRYGQDDGYTTLIQNHFDYTTDIRNTPQKDWINALPLAEVWIDVYNKYKLNTFEIITALHHANYTKNPFTTYTELIPFIKMYIPSLEGHKMKSDNDWRETCDAIFTILTCMLHAYGSHTEFVDYKLLELEDMMARLPEEFKSRIVIKKDKYSDRKEAWYQFIESIGLKGELNSYEKTLAQNKESLWRYYQLKMYILSASNAYPKLPLNHDLILAKKPKHSYPPSIYTIYQAFKQGFITENELQFHMLLNSSIIELLDNRNTNHYLYKQFEKEELPTHLVNPFKKVFLDIELERGDLPTEVSGYMNSFKKIYGINNLLRLLERLEKENFNRGYYYSDAPSKKQMFSLLIKRCFPSETDTFEQFKQMADDSKVSKTRWIELAAYVPHWAKWIGDYLKMPELIDAVWWFHAHASDYMSKEKEAIISRYSQVDKDEFKDGAFDVDWFNEVYKALGKSNWKIIHEASKYISDGHAHRQVKLYSNVMLGQVKIRETLDKIKSKRDKIYVKGLGLIPLSKTNPQKDLLTRYNILQTFLKESKQFGAQRQESEKKAVEIGLDNLSRNAGFQDSMRFSWAMEAKATEAIMNEALIEIGDVKIELIVDENGKADIFIEKKGKLQKSIPAKLKKDKQVIKLLEGKTYLKKQYSRTRKSLEEAMLKEDGFTQNELSIIMTHPVVKAMLGKLVLLNKVSGASGFWKTNGIYDLTGNKIESTEKDLFVIAHVAHLQKHNMWAIYQKHAFKSELVQPFKQIFRELYVVTKDELESQNNSQRYQGHQIQPKKTIALLRSRGWTVDYDDGLQKVYHKKGYIVTLYAMADWYSPSDVESPTIEYVSFTNKKDYKRVHLKDVDPVVFSEVMRDVDLVVSVAHVGGVDPEASHSTMEMRGALARETASLFKLQNIEVKERYIVIDGQLGNYSIHLGSGIVSQNGMSLSIIPVHSQHRGRMFLPFIDDDPKSAEIISKMKLLAEDNKIQDPTVLAQLVR